MSLVVLAGCGALAGGPRGETVLVTPTNARAQIVEGLLRIEGGERLVWEYVTTNVFDDVVPEHGVVFALRGPNVAQQIAASDRNHGALDWNRSWPAGTYRLALLHHGTPLTEQTFEVRAVPRADGTTQPIVALDRAAPLRMFQHTAHTLITISVLRPVVTTEFVWVRDHAVLPVRANESGSEPARIDRLRSLGRLADHVVVTSHVRRDLDLTGATLYVFENGETLVGAWRYVDAARTQPVDLPPITPDARDLALARAAAAERASWSKRSIPELALRVDESIACAVAQNKDARDAYTRWSTEDIAEQSGTSTQLDKQAQAESVHLTKSERAQLASDRRQAGRLTVLAGGKKRNAMDVVKSIARHYKRGCLAAMGVPMPRAGR